MDNWAIQMCGLEVADKLISSLVAARMTQLRRRAHTVNRMGGGQQALPLAMEQPLSLNGQLVGCGYWMRINSLSLSQLKFCSIRSLLDASAGGRRGHHPPGLENQPDTCMFKWRVRCDAQLSTQLETPVGARLAHEQTSESGLFVP